MALLRHCVCGNDQLPHGCLWHYCVIAFVAIISKYQPPFSYRVCNVAHSTVELCNVAHSTVEHCNVAHSTVELCNVAHSTVELCNVAHSAVELCVSQRFLDVVKVNSQNLESA